MLLISLLNILRRIFHTLAKSLLQLSNFLLLLLIICILESFSALPGSHSGRVATGWRFRQTFIDNLYFRIFIQNWIMGTGIRGLVVVHLDHWLTIVLRSLSCVNKVNFKRFAYCINRSLYLIFYWLCVKFYNFGLGLIREQSSFMVRCGVT